MDVFCGLLLIYVQPFKIDVTAKIVDELMSGSTR